MCRFAKSCQGLFRPNLRLFKDAALQLVGNLGEGHLGRLDIGCQGKLSTGLLAEELRHKWQRRPAALANNNTRLNVGLAQYKATLKVLNEGTFPLKCLKEMQRDGTLGLTDNVLTLD